jgi:hypothetical protein
MMPANDQTNENEEYDDGYDDDGKNHLLMFVSFWLPHDLLTDFYFFCLSMLFKMTTTRNLMMTTIQILTMIMMAKHHARKR